MYLKNKLDKLKISNSKIVIASSSIMVFWISFFNNISVSPSMDLKPGQKVEMNKNQLMSALHDFQKEYSLWLNVFIAFVIITSLLVFIYHFMMLGAKACDHPLLRKEAINNIIISGVCLALTGAGGIIYYILFYIGLG